MRYKQTTFDNILKNNKQSIIEYLLSHIDDSRLSPTKEDKIELDCPYCADSKHKRYKMMINLDWSARVKCYRCGKSVSIFALAKKLGFYNDFISFLQKLILDIIEDSYKCAISIVDKINKDMKKKHLPLRLHVFCAAGHYATRLHGLLPTFVP